ncbi:MAG: response regulator transcription factor [Acidobacteria bacterium]|nr:response regulator transcription factor [Acidobacteriota bacterium]MCG3191429.1 Transcriptional regulatory protein BtsR [Thermoanaerobaculia bacterium]MCK6681507.1 LytTR family DNA-binding domain-containing protein [Thermoanaerobaculia bacterium]
MTPGRPTALIAEDEPLLREDLRRKLAEAWPELQIVAEARNGREAIQLFEETAPAICFLDVLMPGLTGVEAASYIGGRAHVVFVTAFDHYAVQAFAQGALDYILKPVEASRLQTTVARLKSRLEAAQPAINTVELLRQLTEELARLGGALRGPESGPLRWIHAQAGQVVRVIPVDEVDYFRSEAKCTVVAWRESGQPREAVVRTSLRDLVSRLDPARFAQVHRSVVVNLDAIRLVKRQDNDRADIHLKGRLETLPVSRAYLHLFRSM